VSTFQFPGYRFFAAVCGILLILTLGTALLSCVSDQPGAPTQVLRRGAPPGAEVVASRGRTGGTLRYSIPGEPETFNPLTVYDTRTALVVHLTSGTILDLDPFTQQIQPGVVADYTRSEDGTRFDFTLREGLRFSDGTPVTADDVVYTFRQIYREDSNNSLKDSLLVNGRPIGVEKLGADRFRLQFPEVYAPAEYILSGIPILPRHLLEKETRPIEELWTLDTPPEKMAGLGPFVLTTYKPGMRAVFSANPYYWKVDSQGAQLPYLERFVLEYIPDRNHQLLRFQAGELEILDQLVRPEDYQVLQDQTGITVRDLGPSNTVTFLWFNLSPGREKASADWFSSLDFRRAVCSAIDRSAIVSNVYQGLATEAWNLLSPANPLWFSPEIKACRRDVEAARKMLREAGFSWKIMEGRERLVDSAGRAITFELLTRSDDVFGRIAAIIQQDLAELGMQVMIRQEEFRSVISRIMGSRTYESALMKLDIPTDPTALAAVLLSSGPMHMWNPRQEKPATRWEAQIDKWVALQAVTAPLEKRQEIVRRIYSTLAEQVPLIPLVHRNVVAAWHRGVAGIRPAPVFPHTLWNVWELSLNEETAP